MRKVFVVVATTGLLFAACAEDDPTLGGETAPTGATETGATGATAETTAASCAETNAAAFESPGTLTVATGNPAFPPWWEGGAGEDSEFEFNDPANGQGYEGAMVAELASRLGFVFPDEVTFLGIG